MVKSFRAGIFLLLLVACSSDDDAFNVEPISNLIMAPDPATEDITISFDLMTSASVQVLIRNRWGKAVHEITNDSISSGRHHFHFDVFDDVAGIYYVQVATEQDTLKGNFQKSL